MTDYYVVNMPCLVSVLPFGSNAFFAYWIINPACLFDFIFWLYIIWDLLVFYLEQSDPAFVTINLLHIGLYNMPKNPLLQEASL